MSKLDKILDDWLVHDSGCNSSLYNEPCDCIQSKVKVNVSREIKDLMLELVGEDETEIGNHGKNEHTTIPARNNLRFKLRQKVEAL